MSIEFSQLLFAIWQTLYMVSVSAVVAVLIGLPLGIALFFFKPNGLLSNKWLYQSLSALVNVGRSIPFVILMIALIPLTRALVGTAIGTSAAIVPLSLSAIPFFARIVANALDDLPKGLTETGLSMGAKPLQLIKNILLPEIQIPLINGFILTTITLVGYSAMAGAVGGGGLGDLAIRYGYQRFDGVVMLITVLFMIIMVQLLQLLGDRLTRVLMHKYH